MHITKVALALAGLLFHASAIYAEDSDVYRLPSNILPTAQTIDLKLNPSMPDYSGSTVILIDVQEDVERIGIHQLGLEMSAITLTSDGKSRNLESTIAGYDINWLSDGETIAAGQYELSIDFTGELAKDSLGMHRSRFEDRDYIFTQFESMYARRAIPTFDEPAFKIPFQLNIEAPEALTVIANSPVMSESTFDGWQRVKFEPTKPLPTYLIAYAVGPMDRAEIKGMSVPGYIYTPVDHADELGFVLSETANIVNALEDYFGSEYPFQKLDFIAVPEFAFGAMENPGLITYRTDILMLGDNPTGRTAAASLSTIAHEVAHIWYGDVVTMEWWDDLWLNESFASWMAGKMIHQLYPQYETDLILPQIDAFEADQRVSSKAIRKEVRTEAQAFEDISLPYTKGRTLLTMLENYVGADVWQRSVRKYIEKFAWSNATEQDLWAVVSAESGLDIGKIAGDYLNQPGFAILDINKNGEVTQQRYVPAGLEAPDLQWHIPLNVKYKKNDKVQETFYLLEGKSGTIDVPADADWIMPDGGGNGYFRWQTNIDQFYALVDDLAELENREKIALLDNADALLNANQMSLADYMFVMNKMLDDPHPLVVLPTIEKVLIIGSAFIGPDNADAFARFIDAELSERFAEDGIDTGDDDNEALIQMRPRLLRVLGQWGADLAVREAASEMADRYLESPESVNGRLGLEALRVTALNDDGGRYKKYIDTYLGSKNANQQSSILSAIYFKDPATITAFLDFSISEHVPAGDGVKGIQFYAFLLSDHTIIYEWLDENFDAFEAKIPEFYHPVLPQVMIGGCNEKNRAMLNSFFENSGEQYQTSLVKALEETDSCIARRARDGDALMEFLAQYD